MSEPRRARRVSELEIAGKRQEWQMLLVARAKRVREEEARLGRPLTDREKADAEWNVKVPTVIDMLLGHYPKDRDDA